MTDAHDDFLSKLDRDALLFWVRDYRKKLDEARASYDALLRGYDWCQNIMRSARDGRLDERPDYAAVKYDDLRAWKLPRY